MTENKRFIETISTGIVMDTVTEKEYNCEMRIDDDFLNLVNTIAEENEELKKELSEYKDFVLSDDKILCYTCLFCTHKGIYEVDCDVKGHVDVHGTCHSYTKKELQE